MSGGALAEAAEAARQLPLWQYFLLLCLMHMAILSQQLTMVQVLENSNYIPASIGVSLATWGDMTGLPSYATFALASMFISGEMADSFNRPRLLGIVLVILSGLTMLHGACRTEGSFMLIRVATSFMQPWCFPCVMGIIASRAPPGYLMSGIGFAMVGWATSDGLALEITTAFGTDWALGFIVDGFIILATAIPCFFIPEVPRPHAATNFKELGKSMALAYGRVLYALPRCASLVLAVLSLLVDGIGGAMASFIQLWLVNDRGYSSDTASGNMAIIVLTASVAGFFFTGWFADWIKRKAGVSYFYTTAALNLFDGGFQLLACLVSPQAPGLMWFLVVMHNFFNATGISSIQGALTNELVPEAYVSSVIGLCLGFGFLGIGIGVTVTSDIITGLEPNPPLLYGEPAATAYSIIVLCAIKLLAVPFTLLMAYLAPADKIKLERMLAESTTLLPVKGELGAKLVEDPAPSKGCLGCAC